MFGWIYMGAATYFIYIFFEPFWHMAKGQLIGFLAYDLILIGPFLAHIGNVLPEHRLSLMTYLGAIIYSAAVAIYYLFIRRPERTQIPHLQAS